MFGNQISRYGLSLEDEERAKEQYIRSIFGAIAGSANNLHQGGIDFSGVSMDEIARSLYEQRQDEAHTASQLEQQQFYRDIATEDRDRQKRNDARDQDERLRGEFADMQDRARETAVAETEAETQRRAFKIRAEQAARDRLQFDSLLEQYDGPDRSAIGALYSSDPRRAAATLVDRMAPQEASSAGTYSNFTDPATGKVHRTSSKSPALGPVISEGAPPEVDGGTLSSTDRWLLTRASALQKADNEFAAQSALLSGTEPPPPKPFAQYLEQAASDLSSLGGEESLETKRQIDEFLATADAEDRAAIEEFRGTMSDEEILSIINSLPGAEMGSPPPVRGMPASAGATVIPQGALMMGATQEGATEMDWSNVWQQLADVNKREQAPRKSPPKTRGMADIHRTHGYEGMSVEDRRAMDAARPDPKQAAEFDARELHQKSEAIRTGEMAMSPEEALNEARSMLSPEDQEVFNGRVAKWWRRKALSDKERASLALLVASLVADPRFRFDPESDQFAVVEGSP